MSKRIKGLIFLLIVILTVCLIVGIKNYRISSYISDDYEPKYIVNELYKSNEINYRLALDSKEKIIYETIIENYMSFNTSFDIDVSSYDYKYVSQYLEKVSDIISAVNMDHPELIHVGLATIQTRMGTGKVTVVPSYVMTKDEYEKNIIEVKNHIEVVKEVTKDFNDFDKVKYVYDYIGKSNHYGNTSDSMAQSAYSAFNGSLSPVCAGYARASQILFNNIGIDSLLVSGEAEYILFIGGSHAWNIVKIESKYYLYDVTMSSGAYIESDFYRGFLISGSKHKPTFKKTYPYLTGYKYKNVYTN